MNATELKLAELIREHPNLYDHSRLDYKESFKGHLSWNEIAVAMEKSDEEVTLIWKNLRDKFSKAKKRLVKRTSHRPNDNGSQVENLVPELFHQMAWLSAFVQHRVERNVPEPEKTSVAEKKVAGRADHLGKPQNTDKKVELNFLPVISNSFSLADSSQSSHQNAAASLKRKSQTNTEMERSSDDALSSLRDEDELFLLSLLPSIKRLTVKKRMEVRIKFQQVLYAAEFED
uniref:Transcription factor Adf-1 n=1 Tax=Nothobranchius kadleci TaxID=1051664 RepID=A0A1A8DXG0_NOTKA